MKSKERQQAHLLQDADPASCYICETSGWGLQYHHTSYKPEKTVRVCSECHGQIHSTNSDYDHLKPARSRPETDYHHKEEAT